jgi:GH18 family chitinase
MIQTNWVSYDDEETFAVKVAYAKDIGFGKFISFCYRKCADWEHQVD